MVGLNCSFSNLLIIVKLLFSISSDSTIKVFGDVSFTIPLGSVIFEHLCSLPVDVNEVLFLVLVVNY